MAYQHGIKVLEAETRLTTPINGTSALQVIFGTSPINQVPEGKANQLVIAYSFAEAVEQLGYSEDYEKYTLCQSMDANFRHFNIAPIIFCNVLDPKKHKKKNDTQTISCIGGEATIPIEGILLDSIVVKTGETLLQQEVDYITSFDDNGFVIITMTDKEHASATLQIECDSIAPDLVTERDIIGGYNAKTGEETGLELVRQVYPKFQMTPGLLLAPGWSHKPDVGLVLSAKCEEINGVFSCECLLDLDCTESGAKKYTDCKAVKESCGYSSKHAIVLWPQLLIGTKQYAYSAIYGAMVAYSDAENGDIPNVSPSSILLRASGAVLADGTEVVLDEPQANLLNGQGIVTTINDLGWKAWGNNTACYPAITDPKDRWICCRRMFTWQGNTFILTYKNKVDSPADRRLIEDIQDSENIRGNSLVAQGKCAGMKIEFLAEENTITDILNGKIQFRQYLAPYTPAEFILNTLEFDPALLEQAFA